MKLREMIEKRAELLEACKATIEEVEKRDDPNMTEEERSEYDAAMDKVNELGDRIKVRRQLEEAMNLDMPANDEKRGVHNGDLPKAPAIHQRRTKDEINAIFCRYVRNGDPGAEREIRAYNDTDMNVTTAADGEVAVPVGFVRDIVARRDEMSLIPRLGIRRVPGKGTTVNYPIDNENDVVFASVGEAATIAQDAPALTEKAFTLVKYAKFITLSWELLRDEDAALLTFIQDWIARGWAGTLNNLLVTEALANGTAGLTLDAAAAIGEGEIPELVGKVLPEYQEGAQWIMHPGTKATIEGMTGDVFQFAPTPGANMMGPTLWGYMNNTSSYMPAIGGGNKSLIFGNFNFMGWREGTTLQTLRDPFSRASNGQVRLWVWFDAVFGVLQAEAIQYATHPTA